MKRCLPAPEKVEIDDVSEDERRRREFLDWVRSPFPAPSGESFPVSQMGPDGTRRARYQKAKVVA